MSIESEKGATAASPGETKTERLPVFVQTDDIQRHFSRVTVSWSRAGRDFPHLIWFTFEGPRDAYARVRLDRKDRSSEWKDPRVMAKTRGLSREALKEAVCFVHDNKEMVCDNPQDEDVTAVFK